MTGTADKYEAETTRTEADYRNSRRMIGRNITNSGCTTVQTDEYKAETALTEVDYRNSRRKLGRKSTNRG